MIISKGVFRIKTLVLFLTLCLGPSLGLQAHHSMSHFSEEFTEMEGTLLEVRWRNPHIYFSVEVEDSSGETKVWQMEAGTIYMVGRAGVREDMFEVGDEIRVAGNMSNLYSDQFWLTNILLPEGRLGEGRTEVLVVARGNPRWTDELVGGRNNWSDTALHEDEGLDDGSGFFQVWSPPGAGSDARAIRDPDSQPLAQITTAAAEAARENWDPYAFDAACELPGMPRVNFGPHPHQFIDGGDRIFFISEENHVQRTFHLESAEDPQDQPFSHLGYSLAQWENENTLVVNTTRINFPYMDLGGTGQSDQVEITERYVLSEDESRIDYKVSVVDPVMLSAPYVRTGVWLDLNEGMGSYDCVVEEYTPRDPDL